MNKNEINLLTFSPELMVWSIINGKTNIVPLSSQLVSKKHETIEDDLIHTFKFLNLNKNLFLEFLKIKTIMGVFLTLILKFSFGADIQQVNKKQLTTHLILKVKSLK